MRSPQCTLPGWRAHSSCSTSCLPGKTHPGAEEREEEEEEKREREEEEEEKREREEEEGGGRGRGRRRRGRGRRKRERRGGKEEEQEDSTLADEKPDLQISQGPKVGPYTCNW